MHRIGQYTCRWVLAASLVGCAAADGEGGDIGADLGGDLGVLQQALVAANGFWRFDDCAAGSTSLQDSSGSQLTATRAAATSCGDRPDGGKTVTFDAQGESVTVPASAGLNFSRNLGVAAWVNASTVDSSRIHSLFRQGTQNEDIVAFQIGHGLLELSLKVRTPGTNSFQIISEKVFDRAIPSGWSHLGATWDGTTIRLFMNGVQVRENRWFTTATDIVGSSSTGAQIGSGPTRNGVTRQFLGSLDEVWVSRQATGAADMAELAALPPPCEAVVSEPKELMITDLRVVEDARATGNGVWTFKHLMESMAPTAAQAPEMVRQMFSTWLTDQTINGQTVSARPSMADSVLTPWLNGGTTLDLSRAPLRLLAIVNRLDLRNLSQGKAGEGRFVFGVLTPEGDARPFTLILEYRLPATSEAQVLEWANLWHELGELDLGSAAYNTKLAQITERFAGRNAEPGRVNGSALSQLRSNEIALSAPWELREFVLSSTNGLLRPDTVKLTPNSSFMDQSIVATFINQNQAAIIAERHDVPNTFNGVSFLGGSSLNNLEHWNAPGINSNEARHKFSLNTCNGCHGNRETGTVFLHVNARAAGQEAPLSGFLTGIDQPDPVDTSTVRRLDDLERRAVDMEALLCSTPGANARGSSLSAASSFIGLGIQRVH
jgi:hypothetical protein